MAETPGPGSPVPPSAPFPADPLLSLELTVVPVLGYAAAHNRIPVVGSVTVVNRGPALRGARLTLEATSADGALGEPSVHLLDLGAGASVSLSDATLLLDPARMLLVEERRPATVVARLHPPRQEDPFAEDGLAAETDPPEHDASAVLAETRADVDLLAAHQWVSAPLDLSLELLAAFVQPHDPVVAVLLAEASALLEESTGSGALEGYRSGPARVDRIVDAVFAAMQRRGIRHSMPPASWSDDGQRIRTPREVLDGRVGTCLDTTVVMAAALEQAGIRAQIWITTGHAFLGYWRDEAAAGRAATTEILPLVNLVDLGALALIETTLVTSPDGEVGDARRRAVVDHLEKRPDTIVGVTDVAAARLARILPLPSRSRDADGAVTVVEYRPADAAAIAEEEYERLPARAHDGTPVPYRVTQWKNALLDLSLRNRLINFSERGRLRLAVPDDDVPHVEDLVNAGRPIVLLPSDEVPRVEGERGIRLGRDLPESDRSAMMRGGGRVFTDIAGAAYDTRMRALAYRARTIEEETGANNLYLALGTLVWSSKDRDLRSPLVLVPVHLVTGRGGRFQVALDESGTSTPNYCLLEKLRAEFDLTVPALASPADDDAGIDLDAAFRAMREAIAGAGLPFRVEATVDLAVLQFAKFRLWKDLDENWQEFAQNALVRHLIETPTEPFVDEAHEVHGSDDALGADGARGSDDLGLAALDLDALSALCPMPADSSQLAAIGAASAGRTFVLEGPPGTGKSQTITNLLVRSVAEGRRVLFVAEKRAALEVVQRRLEDVGVGAFALDLHDKGSRPNAVRAQIKAALQHRVSADRDGLDAATEDLAASRRTLARYASTLHAPNTAGLSLYSARLRQLALDGGVPAVPLPTALVTDVPPARLQAVRHLLRTLPDVAEPARIGRNPWWFLDVPTVRPAGRGLPDPLDQARILEAAARIDEAVAALPVDGALGTAIAAAATPLDLTRLADILGAPPIAPAVVEAARTAVWRDDAGQAITSLALLLANARSELPGIDPAFVDLPVADLHREALIADHSGLFVRRRRRRAVLDGLSDVLSPEVRPRIAETSALTGRLLAFSDRVAAVRRAFSRVAGLEQAADWNPLLESDAGRLHRLKDWTVWLSDALDPASARTSPQFRAGLEATYREARGPDPGSTALLASAREAFEQLAAVVGVGGDALARAVAPAEGPDAAGLVDGWRSPARDPHGTGRLLLSRWVALLEHVEPLRPLGLVELRLGVLRGRLDPESALPALEAGIARTSVAERTQSTGLDAFAASAHDRVTRRFAESTATVREQLASAIPAGLIERRRLDREATGGRPGELRRQLDRQRGGLGVRGLLDRFGDLITEVLPCVLMSPESVARFLTAESGLFDVVVFDEASQVRVADAIGAMGRAHSVVVVGDSRQMPPSSFAETGGGDDDDDREDRSRVQDEESILSECVAARVPSLGLRWHYRSQDETLIGFSNAHYYGDLSSFPSPLHAATDARTADHGISLVRVDGRFLRSGTGTLLRTNPVEAERIVAEVRRRFGPAGEGGTAPSLGVITFNAQQRALIEALLRGTGDPRIAAALDAGADGLFVKNLENVQGDERDTILFSTAFSANERGVLPLNFGPLGQAGGERRLNVAITRARRQVILFSSFDPADLRAEESSSIGLRHLREYLELAASAGRVASVRSTTEEQTDARRSLDRYGSLDRHREDVADGLRGRGLSVVTDVGLSEFRVDLSVALPEAPDRPVAAVLLDSPAWAARRTVADRDGLPVSVLKDLMRWPAVERVWMPDWLAARDEALDRLETAVRAAAEVTPGTAEASATADARPQDPASPGAALPDGDEHEQERHRERAAPGPAAGPDGIDIPGAASPVPFTPWQVAVRGTATTLDGLPAARSDSTPASPAPSRAGGSSVAPTD